MTKKIALQLETVSISEIHPHPRNYRTHPEDQLNHIVESIKEHGLYRNVVIARDGTILAGHGIVEAIRRMDIDSIPVIRLDVDPNDSRALKILTGDNEISHLAEINDRMLTDLLKEIKDIDVNGLLGTGYDEMMLANLVYVTRPHSEIKDFNEAAEWVGLSDYEFAKDALKLIVSFHNKEDRDEFCQKVGFKVTDKTKSVWWPIEDESS